MLVTPTDVVDRPEQKCDSDVDGGAVGKKHRKRRNRRNRGQRQNPGLEEPLQQAGDSDHGDIDDRVPPPDVAANSATAATE